MDSCDADEVQQVTRKEGRKEKKNTRRLIVQKAVAVVVNADGEKGSTGHGFLERCLKESSREGRGLNRCEGCGLV